MNPLGLYEPGTSVVHRVGPGWKLLTLLVFAVLTFAFGSPTVLSGLLVAVIASYGIARIPPRRCLQLARLLIPLAAVVFALQWWMLDWDRALVITLRLVATLAAANLFTLTTRVDDLVTTVEHALGPLRRVGVRPESVGLLVGLTLQAITTLSTIAAEVRETQRARGADRSLSAFAIPFLVRTLRHADNLGEALTARGLDD